MPRHLITRTQQIRFLQTFFPSHFLNKNIGRDSLASSAGGFSINAKLLLVVVPSAADEESETNTLNYEKHPPGDRTLLQH